MFDKVKLAGVLKDYKDAFLNGGWEKEKYKWEAVKCFQDNWDAGAPDFAEMLKKSLAKTGNLLASGANFPARMIVQFATSAPEEVRALFKELFDESQDVWVRIENFKNASEELRRKYFAGAKQHFQYENAITTYLWLRFPDKYYIYKNSEAKKVAYELNYGYKFTRGHYEENIREFNKFYDEIAAELAKDRELVDMMKNKLTPDCYPDPQLRTLTGDVGFYIWERKGDNARAGQTNQKNEFSSTSEKTGDKECNYWWLNANPKIWSFDGIKTGETQFYTLCNENGNKRRIYQNFLDAKAGDIIIGYESNPRKQIIALGKICAEQDGEKLAFEKTESLSTPIDYQTLKEYSELDNMEYFQSPQGSLFKLTKDEYDVIMDIIREENPIEAKNDLKKYGKDEFLKDVYLKDKSGYNRLVAALEHKFNIILQGAPGVGKTYAAKRLAYSIMGVKDDSRVKVVQFHQNYSYENFMLGYKPDGNGFTLKYGVFYTFCQLANSHPEQKYFFIIDEINRGNMSKIFGELLMLIEKDYRGMPITLAENGLSFAVPENLYIIGLMNTADRSLALIDYALRRRFCFIEMEPAFDTEGFKEYQQGLNDQKFDKLIDEIKELNGAIAADRSLGKGFMIGHSYFCNFEKCTDEQMKLIVDNDILPTLREYWFDDLEKYQTWETRLQNIFK